MVAKQIKITRITIFHLPGGQAKSGTALASYGINMTEFTLQFNEQTKERMDDLVPVEITAFCDKSFNFVIKTSLASFLLKKH